MSEAINKVFEILASTPIKIKVPTIKPEITKDLLTILTVSTSAKLTVYGTPFFILENGKALMFKRPKCVINILIDGEMHVNDISDVKFKLSKVIRMARIKDRLPEIGVSDFNSFLDSV